MVWWLSPVLYRIILQKKSIFYTISCKIPFKIFLNYYFFICISIFCNLKNIKSNSLVTLWNALGLTQETTVSLNYSQSIKINIGPSDSGTIISSSRHPTVLYQRLTAFKSEWKCHQGLDGFASQKKNSCSFFIYISQCHSVTKLKSWLSIFIEGGHTANGTPPMLLSTHQ